MESATHTFNIVPFNQYDCLISLFCNGNPQMSTVNELYISPFSEILHELKRMVKQGTKAKKNYERAKIFASILNKPLNLAFNNEIENPNAAINNLINYREELQQCSFFNSILTSSSIDDALYQYQFALKAAATSRVHTLTDELWWCFTIVLDEITSAIKNDAILGPIYNNGDIIIMFKGSRPAGFLLREAIGDDISHPYYFAAQQYGRSGDNDAGIMINPIFGPLRHSQLRIRIINIARRIMIDSRPRFENVIMRLVGPHMTLSPIDTPALLDPIKFELNEDSYPTITNTFPSCTTTNILHDEKPSFIYYSESNISALTDALYKFDLLRLMILYKSNSTVVHLRPDLENIKVKVEIGDLSVVRYDSSDVNNFHRYKVKLSRARINIK